MGGFYELSLLKWVVLGVDVCKKVAGLWSEGEGLVIIVEECGELVRLTGLGSGFLGVVLAGLEVDPKWWGCRVSEGWWGRTVTIGIGAFGRGSG